MAARGPRACPVCDAIFTPRKVGGKWTKTCSRECGHALMAEAMRAGGGRRASVARSLPEHVTLRCEVCDKEWTLAPSQVKGRRTCSRECAAELKRRDGSRRRQQEENPNFRHGRRAGERDRKGERRWYAGRVGSCQHPDCPGRKGRLALHHIVYRQHVRAAGGDLWDPRNGLTLCDGCHMSHHRRGSFVVPVSALPDEAFVFAYELLGAAAFDYMRRRYKGSDERLFALLAPHEQLDVILGDPPSEGR